MKFWISTLVLNLQIPMIMLLVGIRYLKNPAKNINWMHGYRTKRSMKSQETWEFAQRHFGSVCCRWGVGFILLILAAMFSVLGESEKLIGIVGTVLGTAEGMIMIYLLIPTEMALKRKFNMSD